jgi:hypothetical protein
MRFNVGILVALNEIQHVYYRNTRKDDL